MSSRKDSPLNSHSQRFKTETDRERQRAVYDMLRDQGAPEATIQGYRNTETIRKALDNVHDDARNVKERGSPKKINSAAKSKVAGNIKSQSKAKVTKARADYNKASIDAIVSSAMSGRRTMGPSHSRQNSLLSSQSATQLYSPIRGETMYQQSQMGQALAQRIQEKEQELLELRQNLASTEWKNRSATTKLNSVETSIHSPVKASVQTTSYDVQHQQNRRVTTMDSSIVEPVEEDQEEFRVFEEVEFKAQLPTQCSRQFERVDQKQQVQTSSKKQSTQEYLQPQRDDSAAQSNYKKSTSPPKNEVQQVFSSSVLSQKKPVQARKQSAKKTQFDENYVVKKSDLTEAKSLSNPPKICGDIAACVVEILTGEAPQSNGWKEFQKLIANPNEACQTLQEFVVLSQQGKLDGQRLQRSAQFVTEHSMGDVVKKSQAFGSLYKWLEVVTSAHYKEPAHQEQVKKSSKKQSTQVHLPPQKDDSCAQPEIEKILRKLNSIKAADITELSKIRVPAEVTRLVMDTINILFLDPLAQVNPPRSYKLLKQDIPFINDSYDHTCKQLKGPLLANLKTFDKDAINEETIEFLHPYLTLKAPDGQQVFVPKVAKNASAALEGLCSWVQTLSDYYKETAVDRPRTPEPQEPLTQYDSIQAKPQRPQSNYKKSTSPPKNAVQQVLSSSVLSQRKTSQARKQSAKKTQFDENYVVKKSDLTEAKSLSNPPKICGDIAACIVEIFTGEAPQSNGWKEFQKLIANPNEACQTLQEFVVLSQQGKLDGQRLQRSAQFVTEYSVGDVVKKSSAFGSLYKWLEVVTSAHYEGPAEQAQAEHSPHVQVSQRVSGFNAYQHTRSSMNKVKTNDEAPSPLRSKRTSSPPKKSGLKGVITEIKSLNNPPAAVAKVMACVTQIVEAIPAEECNWAQSKITMNKSSFIAELEDIQENVVNNGAKIADEHLTLTRKFLSQNSTQNVMDSSSATRCMSDWLIRVSQFDTSMMPQDESSPEIEREQHYIERKPSIKKKKSIVAEQEIQRAQTASKSMSPARQTKREVVQTDIDKCQQIKRNDFVELKCLSAPPQPIKDLLASMVQIVNQTSSENITWNQCQKFMANVQGAFGEISAINAQVFDQGIPIAENHMTLASKFLSETSLDDVKKRSAAAVGIYLWLEGITQLDLDCLRTSVITEQPKKVRKSPVKKTKKEVVQVATPNVQRAPTQTDLNLCQQIKKSDINELKSLKAPPQMIEDLLACMVQIVKQIPAKDITWNQIQKFLASPDLISEICAVNAQVFDYGIPIQEQNMTLASYFLPGTSVENVICKSFAAGSIYQWLVGITQLDLDCLRTSVSSAQFKKVSKSPVKKTTKKSQKMAESIVPMQRRTNSLSKFEQIPGENRSRMWSLKYEEAAPSTVQQAQSNSYYIAPAPMEPTFSSQRPVIDISGANAQYNKATGSPKNKQVFQIEQTLKQHSNPGNKFHNNDLEAKTHAIQQEFERLRASQSGTINRYNTMTGTQSQDNFYTIMDDFYHGEDVTRHDSPTKRLIAQKNSAWKGKEKIQHDVRRKSEYAIHYTTEPGKSYVIEPKEGEINYDLAYKNPRAFYNKVMTQEVTEHKVYSPRKGAPLELQSTITKRKVGEVLMTVMLKMHDLLKEGGLQDGLVKTAMEDEGVKKVIYNYMRKDSIKLVSPKGSHIFRKETKLLGEKGDRAVNESPVDPVEGDPADLEEAELEVDNEAFNEVQKSVNEYIRKQHTKK